MQKNQMIVDVLLLLNLQEDIKMKIKQGEKIKLKVEIIVEVSSDEYEDTDTIIDELSSESFYTIESTECVTVHNTEYSDCQLL